MFHLQFNGEGHLLYYREKASPFHNSYSFASSKEIGFQVFHLLTNLY